jgi:hypothetical protein
MFSLFSFSPLPFLISFFPFFLPSLFSFTFSLKQVKKACIKDSILFLADLLSLTCFYCTQLSWWAKKILDFHFVNFIESQTASCESFCFKIVTILLWRWKNGSGPSSGDRHLPWICWPCQPSSSTTSCYAHNRSGAFHCGPMVSLRLSWEVRGSQIGGPNRAPVWAFSTANVSLI